MRLEVLVEEESAEEALRVLIPRIVCDVSLYIHRHNGKQDLLRKLPARLKGYRKWLPGPAEARIVVLVDEDRADCLALKKRLEEAATSAGFSTQSTSKDPQFEVLNRIAVEELEAWFFGDMAAVRAAYPDVRPNLNRKAKFRDPDAIKGGTWEALETVLQRAGYHQGGLGKIQAARDIAHYMDPDRNRSRSFTVFRDGLLAIAAS